MFDKTKLNSHVWTNVTGILSRWWMKFPAMRRWSLDATGAGSPTNAVDPSKLYDFADTARPNAWTTSQTDLRCRPCSAQRVVHRVINSPRMLDVLHGPVVAEPDARAHRPPRANKSSGEMHPGRWRSATHENVCRVGRDTRCANETSGDLSRSRVIRGNESINCKTIERGRCA